MTSKHVFTTKAITVILRECLKSGVAELKLGDLCVRFHPSSTRHVEPPADFVPDIPADPAEMGTAPGHVGHVPTRVPKSTLEEFAETQLAIDDPYSHETLMIDRHLGVSVETDERTDSY